MIETSNGFTNILVDHNVDEYMYVKSNAYDKI